MDPGDPNSHPPASEAKVLPTKPSPQPQEMYVLFWFCFFETEFLCGALAVCKLKRSIHLLWLPRTGVRGLHHHQPAAPRFLILYFHIEMVSHTPNTSNNQQHPPSHTPAGLLRFLWGYSKHTAAVVLSSLLSGSLPLPPALSQPTLVSCSRRRLLVLTSETLLVTDHSALRGSEIREHKNLFPRQPYHVNI